jgi:hypothetical protein
MKIKMKRLKLIERVGITPLTGDVASLHKGSLEVITAKSKSDLFWSKSGVKTSKSRSALKAALKRAVSLRELDLKVKLLPNVASFTLKLGQINPLLFTHGLLSRFGSRKVLIQGRNRNLNRYLVYMYLRLHRYKTLNKPNIYWVVAMTLISRSHSYLIANVHHLDGNLYRIRSKQSVIKMLKDLNKMRGLGLKNDMFQQCLQKGYLVKTSFETLLKHHRTYLPKGDTFRPLGVPTFNWRVFTNMWLTPLNGFYTIGDYQQGFLPRRGTLTAWKKVSREVLTSRNIYEVDFKGFFPSVNPSLVSLFLSARGMPKPLTDYLLDLGVSYPSRKSLDNTKLDESISLHRAELDSIGLLTGYGIVQTGSSSTIDELTAPHHRPSEEAALIGDTPLSTKGTKRDRNPSTAPKLDQFRFNRDGIIVPPKWIYSRGPKAGYLVPEQYRGVVLKKYYDEIAAGNLDSLLNRMSEQLGYSPDLIKSDWWAIVYEFWQLESAIEESMVGHNSATDKCKEVISNFFDLYSSHGIKECLAKLLRSPQFMDDPWDADSTREQLDQIPENNIENFIKAVRSLLGTMINDSNRIKYSHTLTVLNALSAAPRLGMDWEMVNAAQDSWHKVSDLLRSYSVTETNMPEVNPPAESLGFSKSETIHKELVSEGGRQAAYKIVREKQVIGLPQGSPLSPFLSILLLEYAYLDLKAKYPNVHWCFYADDGIFHSDDDLEFQNFLSDLDGYLSKLGITISKEKSFVTRMSGRWLRGRLKFLGIVYEPATNTLYSETRSGRHLLYSFQGLTMQSLAMKDLEQAFPAILKIFLEYLLDNKEILNYMATLGLLERAEKKTPKFEKSRYKRVLKASAVKLTMASLREHMGGLTRSSLQLFYKYANVLLKYGKLPELDQKTFSPKNFFDGIFGGLIQARLYYGSKTIDSFNTSSGGQSFKLSSVKGKKDRFNGSLGQILTTRLGSSIDIKNGSSYATHEMVMLSQFSVGARKTHKLLTKGAITRNLEAAV